LNFRRVARANRSGDIHAQSHVRLGVFLPKIPRTSRVPKCWNHPTKNLNVGLLER